MIDLSRYRTPPAVAGETGFEAARLAWLADFAARLRDWDAAGSESDPAVKICETGATRETVLVQAANDAGAQCMLPWARGAALDALAANALTQRLAGESDDALRQRAAAALPGMSAAGPESSYVRLARAATPLAAQASAARTAPGAITVTALIAAGTEELALDGLPPAPGEAMRALVEAGSDAVYAAGSEGRILAGSAAVTGASASLAGLSFDGSSNELVATFDASVAAWAAGGGAGRALSLFLHDGRAGVELKIADGVSGGAGTTLTWAVAGAADRALLAGIGEDERALAIVATANPDPPDLPGVETGQTAREARMLRAIRAQLNRRDVRPMGDIVTVRAAALVSWSVSATIAPAAGADAATVLAAAIAAVKAYGAEARRPGAAVKRGALFAALYQPGVSDAAVAAPAVDIAAVANSAPDLGTVEVTLQ